ncbi:MAG: 30S ribosome-binding factor RbfA [Candidatus Gastranaerophilales bacterium]|nr:30S ribosome-binding factor RbfA [Candidatus Gastranaerophilales bacterium]
MTLRNERVRKTLMKEIADILQREIRDTRISGVVSILDVEVSHDNSYAKVYYSVFGNEEQKEKIIEAMEQNTPKIRYEVGKRVRLRLTPELRFIYDDSIERGSKVTEIIDKISRGEL